MTPKKDIIKYRIQQIRVSDLFTPIEKIKLIKTNGERLRLLKKQK